MDNEKPSFWGKYREIIIYIIVGILTTIFCWTFNWVLTLFLDASNTAINFFMQTVNWVAGVLFAFPLNRKWVFKSQNPKWFSEFLKFAGSRVSTWIIDALIMVFFVNICPLTGLARWLSNVLANIGIGMEIDAANYWFAKIFISSVVVMIVNYVFSKMLVFKKDNETKEDITQE